MTATTQLGCLAWTTTTSRPRIASHRHPYDNNKDIMRNSCQKNYEQSETRRASHFHFEEECTRTRDDHSICQNAKIRKNANQSHHITKKSNDKYKGSDVSLPDRRKVLQSTTMILLGGLSVLSGSESVQAATTTTSDNNCLVDLAVGQGSWQPLSKYKNNNIDTATDEYKSDTVLPASFVSYGTRVALRYDPAVQEWWQEETTRRRRRNNNDDNKDESSEKLFTSLAASLGRTWQHAIVATASSSSSQQLYEQYLASYPKGAQRHINLWFALLPAEWQPQTWHLQPSPHTNTAAPFADSEDLVQFFDHDLTALLPEPYHVTLVEKDATARIAPDLPINSFVWGSSSSSLSSSLSSLLLTREQPVYGPAVYAALGLAGGVGCALTHATVIPLDVVKTRAQMTDATSSSSSSSKRNLWQQAGRMVERQGWSSLFLGAQATIVGYLWYGISVYPTYTASKRWLWASDSVTDTLNPDAIALLAGAVAAVVASLGLTPLEAARIRAVANPRKYAKLGVVGTLQILVDEQVLYAGLPSLLTRQVVFGSIKFLAFERFAVALTSTWPDALGSPDVSWLVSLLAGGLSGFVSAAVSQPADSLLTYVSAQKRSSKTSGQSNTLNLWQGLQQLWMEEGPGALWRGLGSRSIWAGSIIAGQFFLYDIFRTAGGVSSADLTQVWDYQINF
eukprot:scaffold19_cov169-Amphora_coffeaeformis.AAC.8